MGTFIAMRMPQGPVKGRLRDVAQFALALGCAMMSAAAQARSAEVCPGPSLPPVGCFTIDTSIIGGRPFGDFVITRPGKLLFDATRRRNELAALDSRAMGAYCAVNPLAQEAKGLPDVSFSNATVTFWESRWRVAGVEHVREYARVAFDGLRTSDGVTYPRFGLAFNRDQKDSVLRLEFFPSTDPNLVGIPGLGRDVYLNVETVTGANAFQNLDDLPGPLRRTLLAIAYKLSALFASVPNVVVTPGAVDPLWDQQGVSQVAATFSGIGFGTPLPTFAPIVTLTCDLGNAGATTCQESVDLNKFRDFAIRYGADYLASHDPGVGAALLANFRNWAQAQALTVYPGVVVGATNQPDFRPKYELQWVLVPIIETWSLLRNEPMVSASDRSLIDGWLDRLVSYGTEPFGGPGAPEDPFNVSYLRRGLSMAWGIITGKHVAVAEGMEKVMMGLHQMRADGSFPREVARGACALKYQDTMLLNLMFIAEMAATQGYDAYSLAVDGKTLHTAVTFLLDAVDDPGVVLGYASQDPTNCTSEPPLPTIGLSTVIEAPGGFNYSAWLEPYIARFPDHPNSVRLRNLLRGGLNANRPIFHPHAGGNTTCFSAASKIPPITPPGTSVEYFHAGMEHYFISATAVEVDALDAGVFAGWARTGEAFKVPPANAPGATNVCRFFTTAFPPKSSHFYTPSATECARVQQNPDWQYEGIVFGLRLPGEVGTCAAGTLPLYRLYNNGQTGAPNHRYTTSVGIRSQMVGHGFADEGVVGCVQPN